MKDSYESYGSVYAGRSVGLFLRAAHEDRWCWKHCCVAMPEILYVNMSYSHLKFVHFNFHISDMNLDHSPFTTIPN